MIILFILFFFSQCSATRPNDLSVEIAAQFFRSDESLKSALSSHLNELNTNNASCLSEPVQHNLSVARQAAPIYINANVHRQEVRHNAMLTNSVPVSANIFDWTKHHKKIICGALLLGSYAMIQTYISSLTSTLQKSKLYLKRSQATIYRLAESFLSEDFTDLLPVVENELAQLESYHTIISWL